MTAGRGVKASLTEVSGNRGRCRRPAISETARAGKGAGRIGNMKPLFRSHISETARIGAGAGCFGNKERCGRTAISETARAAIRRIEVLPRERRPFPPPNGGQTCRRGCVRRREDSFAAHDPVRDQQPSLCRARRLTCMFGYCLLCQQWPKRAFRQARPAQRQHRPKKGEGGYRMAPIHIPALTMLYLRFRMGMDISMS